MKLDVGCGKRKRGDIGVDINRNSEADVIADAHFLCFRESSFDQLSAYALLEHVDNPNKVLAEMSRVCKKGAHITILVPANSRMICNFIIYFLTFQFKGVLNMYRCNKEREHKWQYSPSSLKTLLKKHGFRILKAEFKAPSFYGANNRFLRMLEKTHRRYPIYKPHLVAEGIKL